MEIEVWKELTKEEEEVLEKAEIVSFSSSLHVSQYRKEHEDQVYRSLYLIETGDLISHEKLVEIVDLDKIKPMKKEGDELVG